MAEYLTWTTELATGSAAMDKEHQELIALMNALYVSNSKKEPKPNIKKHLSALGDFTAKHFTDEEAHMERIKFNKINLHKAIHQQLLQKFTAHVDAFDAGGDTLPEGFFNFLSFWLTSHIKNVDTVYGHFVA